MKLFLPILSSLLLLLLLLSVVVVVESSEGFNITRGSSLSTYSQNNESINGTNYWLSPSGYIAFGFYPLCSDSCRYVVGIWFVKSANKTLVWTANRNDPPLHHPSSILFDNYGKLLLRTGDGREKPLLADMSELASYAKMLDNGNFVLYGSNSTIIWQSFDYPTDTILGGQTLKGGQSLMSSLISKFDPSFKTYELRIRQSHYGTKFEICDVAWDADYIYHWAPDCGINWSKDISPITLNLDSTTGRLYIVDWVNNAALKNITDGENQLLQPQQQQQCGDKVYNDVVIYRATLETDGIFYLFKDRIGSECEKSITLWDSSIHEDFDLHLGEVWVLALFLTLVGVALLITAIWIFHILLHLFFGWYYKQFHS